MKPLLRAAVAALLIAWAGVGSASEYDFDIPEAENKPYEFSGRLEMRFIQHHLDDQSSRYRLNYYGQDPGNYINQLSTQLELKGSYRLGIAKFHLLTHHEYVLSTEDEDRQDMIYEAYVSLKPSANFTLEVGKKPYLWGKGYAWNPAGFINRPKDPDDPELNLEGRTAITAEYIKSFTGSSLNNIAFTALALPAFEDWENSDLGEDGDINYAMKLYALWYDTDLDFIYFGGPNQSNSLGFDFAKNLAENFEVHGEVGLKLDATRMVLDASGQATTKEENQLSFMAGLRYLNSLDTTFIAEYYHNGAGYSGSELDDFFAYQDSAYDQWLASGNDSIMERAERLSRPYYRQRNFGRDYLYLKVSQKEPFDFLYFTPWLTVIVNLHDLSCNLQPGMSYTPITNLELNFRVGIPIGPSGTEFGEKQDSVRPEFWVRYYF